MMGRSTRSRTNTNTRPMNTNAKSPAKQALTDFPSRFDKHRVFVHGLQICWIGLVYWLEVGVFNWAFHACHWPGPELDSPPRTARILLIADPQIVDSHSYAGRGWILSTLTRIIVDLNLRKSWRLVAIKMRPHAVIFLGDMMDGGRGDLGDDEYERYYKRFKSIFEIPYTPSPVHYIPGNHDTGIGGSDAFSPSRAARYISHFGPLNRRIEISNHSIIFLDAPGLVEEDRQRLQYGYDFSSWSAKPNGPVDFIKKLPESATGISGKSTVLFSHIPLSRPEGTDCGPLREKGSINQGWGFGYQNTLSEETTEFVLGSIRPSIIFSGDDHDYCSTKHSLPPHPSDPSHKHIEAEEISVKSMSMVMNVRKPGFQLLSLVSPTSPYDPTSGSELHTPCALPDQLGIYIWGYGLLALLSVIGVVVSNYKRVRGPRRSRYDRPPSGSPTKEEQAEAGEAVGMRPVVKRRGSSYTGRPSGMANGNGHYFNGDASLSSANGSPAESVIFEEQLSPRSTHRRRGYTFTLGSSLRRISIPYLSRGGSRSGRWQRHREKGLAGGVLSDVRQVAWPPVLVWIGIALWMFNR